MLSCDPILSKHLLDLSPRPGSRLPTQRLQESQTAESQLEAPRTAAPEAVAAVRVKEPSGVVEEKLSERDLKTGRCPGRGENIQKPGVCVCFCHDVFWFWCKSDIINMQELCPI